MRLIDADVIHGLLADKLKWLMMYGDDVYIEVGDDIRDVIENIPTAYDVDKVVKQITEAQKDPNLYVYAWDAYQKAIEIVKGGVE